MKHPKIPLQDEQKQEADKLDMSNPIRFVAELVKLRKQFKARRDAEFPGWLQKYEAEMQEWFKSQGVKIETPCHL